MAVPVLALLDGWETVARHSVLPADSGRTALRCAPVGTMLPATGPMGSVLANQAGRVPSAHHPALMASTASGVDFRAPVSMVVRAIM